MTESPAEWILLVHIGPVQDFIASARRCRDLWYGSRLLSVLADAATRAMLDKAGLTAGDRAAAAIFPGAVDHDDRSVANKIQLRLRTTQAEVEAIAQAGQEAVAQRMKQIAGEVFDGVSDRDGRNHFHRESAERHVADLMEFLWVAVPEGGAYAEARASAEQLLAARKNTRDWGQPPLAGFGIPKSSLDGVRESVVDEAVYDAKSGYSAGQRRRTFGVQPAERLCGVGMLKRLGKDPAGRDGDEPRFHSAGHIASASTRAHFAQLAERDPDITGLWNNYLLALENAGINLRDFYVQNGALDHWQTPVGASVPRTLQTQEGHRSFGLDGVLLFPERLKSLISEYADDLDDAAASVAEDSLRKLLRELGAGRGPFPYYAMILADGDRMGVALSEMTSPDAHRTFSKLLEAEFASKCGELVERHGGSLLYAGGDDVLAIAPVLTVLQLSRALRDLFDAAMVKAAPAEHRPTLSVGVAICHFLEPFTNVRAFAKKAEGLAKNSAGRNALAMVVKKRGATEKIVHGKWEDSDAALDRRLLTWAQLLAEQQLPMSTAYHLEEIIPTFGVSKEASPVTATLVTALVKRVLHRRDVTGAVREDLLNLFTETYLPVHDNPLDALRMMSDELQIAMVLKQAQSDAFPPAEEHVA